MQPVRADVFNAVEYEKEPGEFTLREIVEWHKKVVGLVMPLGQPRTKETRLIDERWNHLVGEVAKREGVPSGWLSYLCGELARTETRAKELAQDVVDTTLQELQ